MRWVKKLSLHTLAAMMLIMRSFSPAFLMHSIRSFHVHGTAQPLFEYHWCSTARTNESSSFDSLRIPPTAMTSSSRRAAKLSHSEEEWMAIDPAILRLPNPFHWLTWIRSFHVGPVERGQKRSLLFHKTAHNNWPAHCHLSTRVQQWTGMCLYWH